MHIYAANDDESAVPVPAGTWTLLSHPTPHHPSHPTASELFFRTGRASEWNFGCASERVTVSLSWNPKVSFSGGLTDPRFGALSDPMVL